MHVQRESRIIKNELLVGLPVIDRYPAPAVNAHENLMQFAMGVFTPDFLGGHVRNQEIAFHVKGDLLLDLCEGQEPTLVSNLGQSLKRHACHGA
jgi:hypothetical protein